MSSIIKPNTTAIDYCKKLYIPFILKPDTTKVETFEKDVLLYIPFILKPDTTYDL